MRRQETIRHKILFTALAIFLLTPAIQAGEYSHARVVRLSLVEGDVQVTSPDQPGWQKAIVNMPVREGMSIATAQGRAEIEFESEATARIADNTVLQFTEMALADGKRITRLNLSQGTATIYTNRGHHDTLTVQAGKLAIAVGDHAQFRIDVFEDGASVSVLKGNAEVATAGGSRRVNKGQTLALRNDASDQIALERNPAPDTWDHWVSDRENALEVGRSDSQRYFSTPVSYGLADLSYYGGWYNYGGYGNCWRPAGVGLGWSPYYNGNWSYLPGFGFTWTSFEPWGWMPYHYGRWAFSQAYGWLWVPGNFHTWNPGAVYWVRTPGRVGWVPLAPHDQPGGTPQNLPQGVITNTTAGLATGQPHHIGPLAAGESPRFVADPRADQEMVRTGEQINAAAASRAALPTAHARIAIPSGAVTPAGGIQRTTDSSAATTSPAPARRMSEREIKTTPARIFTVAPTSPTAPTSAAGSHSGTPGASSGSSAPHPSNSASSSGPAPSSHPSRTEHPAPASHPSPASHPPSSHPPSSHR